MSETSKSFSDEYWEKTIESKFEGHCGGGESDKIDYEIEEKEQVDLKPVKITEETLKRIRQQLCLIKLGLPKVELDQESSYLKLLPETYSQNSQKEKVLLWYAENFRRQFHQIYRDRKPLLMACDNECGIQVNIAYTNVCILHFLQRI